MPRPADNRVAPTGAHHVWRGMGATPPSTPRQVASCPRHAAPRDLCSSPTTKTLRKENKCFFHFQSNTHRYRKLRKYRKVTEKNKFCCPDTATATAPPPSIQTVLVCRRLPLPEGVNATPSVNARPLTTSGWPRAPWCRRGCDHAHPPAASSPLKDPGAPTYPSVWGF